MRSRTATFNSILFLFGIALILFSFFKLFDPMPLQEGKGKSIGLVTVVENDARLKRSDLFNWDPAAKGSLLASNDSLFTNEDSRASFKLDGGHKIELSQQTLIKIQTETLEVKKGSMRINLAKNATPVRVKLGTQEFSLSAQKNETSVSITNKSGLGNFNVSKGQLRIQTKTTEIVAEAGEEVIAGPLSASKSLTKLNPLFPIDETLILKEEESFQFKAQGAESRHFVIASDGKEERKLPLNEDVKLRPGHYLWSIADETEILSRQNAFSILRMVPAPEQISPAHLETIFYYGDQAEVDFKWEPGFSALLSITSADNRIIHSFRHPQGKGTANFDSEGAYTWKVRSDSEKLRSEWSSERKLVLIKQSPEEGEPYVIELERPNQLAEFHWEKSAPGDRFILSRRRDFGSSVKDVELTNETSLSATLPEVGIYYWKILNNDGRPSEAAPKKVLVRPTPPPAKPMAPPSLRLRLKPKTEKSTWFPSIIRPAYAQNYETSEIVFEEIENAKTYEVEIFLDKRLQRLEKRLRTDSPSFKWKPPRPGVFYWRIRYKDYWDRWSPYSDSSSIKVTLQDLEVAKSLKESSTKQKKQPKPESIKKETVNKNSDKPKNFFGNLGYSPAVVQFIQDSEQEVEINGQALGGHGADFSYKENHGLSYRSSYGSVFSEKAFYNRSFELYALYDYKGIKVGPSLFAGQSSVYPISGGSLEELEESYYALGIRAVKSFSLFKESTVSLGFSAHFLSASHLELFSRFYYKLSKNTGLSVGIEAYKTSFSTEGEDANIQSLRTFLGPYLIF